MIFEVLNKEMPIDDNEQDVREVFGPDMLSQVEPERGGRQVAGHRQENSEVHVGHERSSVGEAAGRDVEPATVTASGTQEVGEKGDARREGKSVSN